MPRDSRGRFTPETRAAVPLADSAFLLITLNRATGEVTIDEEFSTPMETWAMLAWAAADREDRLCAERSEPGEE